MSTSGKTPQQTYDYTEALVKLCGDMGAPMARAMKNQTGDNKRGDYVGFEPDTLIYKLTKYAKRDWPDPYKRMPKAFEVCIAWTDLCQTWIDNNQLLRADDVKKSLLDILYETIRDYISHRNCPLQKDHPNVIGMSNASLSLDVELMKRHAAAYIRQKYEAYEPEREARKRSLDDYLAACEKDSLTDGAVSTSLEGTDSTDVSLSANMDKILQSNIWIRQNKLRYMPSENQKNYPLRGHISVTRERIWREQGCLCNNLNCPCPEISKAELCDMDHIEEQQDGGLHERYNAHAVCCNCHREKTHVNHVERVQKRDRGSDSE